MVIVVNIMDMTGAEAVELKAGKVFVVVKTTQPPKRQLWTNKEAHL